MKGRMTDQSPRSPEGADPEKHRRLLEMAAGEFARIGFERSNVDTIAELAGVGKGTVYLYFENKAALFHAVLAEVRRRLEAMWASDGFAADPVADLRHLIHDQLVLADTAPDLFRCYTSALFGVNRDFQQAALDIFDWQQMVLRRLLERLGTEGSAKALDMRAALLAGSLLAVSLVRGLRSASNRSTALEETSLMRGFLATRGPV
jgi:AcrR family transcriptional regulator